ncbi:MAG: PAS domain-containing protein [Betaproteobacteria bacterium]|nr:PAS domain-containing protein [Betaproteobacteria bacterium]
MIPSRGTPLGVPGQKAPLLPGVGVDATVQEKLNTRLPAQALLECFFESTLTCVALLDLHFNVLRVSKSYADACGRTIEEFTGRNHFEMYPSEAKTVFEEVVRSGKAYSARAHPFVFPDHPERGVTYWDLTLSPVHGEHGKVEMLVFCLYDVTQWRRAEERLQQALIQSEQLAARIASTREREQRRIARELHDEMGQELTALKLLLEDLGQAAPPANTSRLREALAVANRLQARVRTISADLRPPMLEDLGVLAALTWLCERQRLGTGLEVDFRHSGLDRRLRPEHETALYRIIQESLTNVVKHARVPKAVVLVRVANGRAVVKVEDAGVGFDTEACLGSSATVGGVGLLGMRERARSLGGRLTVESTPGAGTAITLELPLEGQPPRSGVRA